MAKLYFHHSTMNAGKSTLLLQAAHTYEEGVRVYLMTFAMDMRAGPGQIGSRIGFARQADTLREVRTICHCGRKATMVVRHDEQGRVLTNGAQVQIGGNETYVSLCRKHWRDATGER